MTGMVAQTSAQKPDRNSRPAIRALFDMRYLTLNEYASCLKRCTIPYHCENCNQGQYPKFALNIKLLNLLDARPERKKSN